MMSPDSGQQAEYDGSPRTLLPINDPPSPTDEHAARTVVIADDCRLFRENLATVLTARGIEVHRLVWDLPSLVVALQTAETGVIVLLNMAIRGVGLLVRAALEIKSDVRIIVLGASEDADSDIIACAEAGVAAYHMRTNTLDELISLIDDVAAGQTLCPPEITAALLRRFSALGAQKPPPPKELVLTARETQILRMLELGRSNREIARYLDIAVHTVKNHVHSLLTKLGVSTRVEAAALARTIRTEGGSPGRSRSRTS
jgi:DNA-binding NarL/FixJ family response regulator